MLPLALPPLISLRTRTPLSFSWRRRIATATTVATTTSCRSGRKRQTPSLDQYHYDRYLFERNHKFTNKEECIVSSSSSSSLRILKYPLSRQRQRLSVYFSTHSNRNDQESYGNDGNIDTSTSSCPQRQRLSSLRNVGIFAHVDAGKTTVTERMLALSGIVQRPGSVDGGDTVTDYLPAERERGITIQSAAVGFEWVVPATSTHSTIVQKGGKRSEERGRNVYINLLDTPGHIDFSVEVHRSVAVLDGAILVVDAVAGAQAQTETVWRAIRNTDVYNNFAINHSGSSRSSSDSNNIHRVSNNVNNIMDSGSAKKMHGTHAHEPLPAIMFVNKMDREGADFRNAIQSVTKKLRGSNPIPIQIPLFRCASSVRHRSDGSKGGGIVVVPNHDQGEYIGLVDLVHMRAVIYPSNAESLSVEDAAPSVIPFFGNNTTANQNYHYDFAPSVLEAALEARRELISHLANVDEILEDSYLTAMMNEDDNEQSGNSSCSILDSISTEEIQSSLRRMTLARKIMPTMCGAALRGLGVEPILDCVAEYLPCPLDRLPPKLSLVGNDDAEKKQNRKNNDVDDDNRSDISLGHPLHPSTLAYVFKVLHMKGRGGSGDGRVAFARVYSGNLKTRDSVRVISPRDTTTHFSDHDSGKNKKQAHPVERIGGMLELSGGQFSNLPDGTCSSGDVCALVGLKSVVTGDTLLSTSVANNSGTSDVKKKATKTGKINDTHWKQYMEGVYLSGLTSPKPVLTLRVEAYSVSDQTRLSAALEMLAIEDPSLVVEETPTTTLISGLGELHMEIILDRLRREFGLVVRTGKPAVSYRETIQFEDGEEAETDGLVEYDRTVGAIRLQGAVHLLFRQWVGQSLDVLRVGQEACFPPVGPVVTLSSEIRSFFNLDSKVSANNSEHKYPPALQALLSGIRGSLKRGRLGPYPLANVECHVLRAHSELSNPDALVGSMRAAAANACMTLLETLTKEGKMIILEPKMNVEIWVPSARVGDVLSDLTGRRGIVNDVTMAEEVGGGSSHVKSMVSAEVPLIEILGYANSLRSLTGGEGAFSAEYKGHAPQDVM